MWVVTFIQPAILINTTSVSWPVVLPWLDVILSAPTNLTYRNLLQLTGHEGC
jgi:hypothetical protein